MVIIIVTLSSPADNMFPYLSIIISMISNAFFLAIRLDQTMLSLIIVCTLDLKNAIIIRKLNTVFPVSLNGLLVLTFCPSMWFLSLSLPPPVGHWLVLAYGIIALQYHISLPLYVPLPALFYVITVKFTDPDEFSAEKGRRGN